MIPPWECWHRLRWHERVSNDNRLFSLVCYQTDFPQAEISNPLYNNLKVSSGVFLVEESKWGTLGACDAFKPRHAVFLWSIMRGALRDDSMDRVALTSGGRRKKKIYIYKKSDIWNWRARPEAACQMWANPLPQPCGWCFFASNRPRCPSSLVPLSSSSSSSSSSEAAFPSTALCRHSVEAFNGVNC